MRNIFFFIRRNFNVFVFVALQIVAIWSLITYNRFYRAKGLGAANEVTGWVNSKFNNVEDFFRMKEENKRILRMNDSLMNLLSSNFAKHDTSSREVQDSIPYDTLGHYRRYIWRDAQVTYNTVNGENNYVQINRGSVDGMKDNMGVFSSNGGLVGKIIHVSPNYSMIMSLLHVRNKLSVVVKKTGSSGMISWDAKNPRLLTLNNISKSDSLVKGDTIVTGNFSLSYPPGRMVGTVEEIVNDNSTNFYVLKIRTTANFSDLQQVQVVENLQYSEQAAVLQETIKKVDEVKKK